MALIDWTEQQALKPLSSNDQEWWNNNVLDLEQKYLQRLLGESFYFDLVKNQTAQKYIDILEPKEFTYDSTTYKHEGLKRVLAYIIEMDYMLTNRFKKTFNGLVMGQTDDAKDTRQSQIRNLRRRTKENAMNYFKTIDLYIQENIDDYEYYNCSEGSLHDTPRMTKVQRY